VAGAVEKRRREFSLGRACAHAALVQLGRDEGPIGRQANGAPRWPAGLVGSLTHTAGYAAAIIASRDDFVAVGLDAERVGGVTPDLWPRLFDADERAWLARQPDTAQAATLFFSAKESVHKAGQEQVLRFHEIHVTLEEHRFLARRNGTEFEGRFAAAGGLVLTLAFRR
jgi:4'-phosphopantetheinyl transferase EntD